MGMLGQVWYLIVSILDLCPLFYGYYPRLMSEGYILAASVHPFFCTGTISRYLGFAEVPNKDRFDAI